MKMSLNVKYELVVGVGGSERSDCPVCEWMAYVKIIHCLVPVRCAVRILGNLMMLSAL